jgi:hypothetical protein
MLINLDVNVVLMKTAFNALKLLMLASFVMNAFSFLKIPVNHAPKIVTSARVRITV